VSGLMLFFWLRKYLIFHTIGPTDCLHGSAAPRSYTEIKTYKLIFALPKLSCSKARNAGY